MSSEISRLRTIAQSGITVMVVAILLGTGTTFVVACCIGLWISVATSGEYVCNWGDWSKGASPTPAIADAFEYLNPGHADFNGYAKTDEGWGIRDLQAGLSLRTNEAGPADAIIWQHRVGWPLPCLKSEMQGRGLRGAQSLRLAVPRTHLIDAFARDRYCFNGSSWMSGRPPVPTSPEPVNAAVNTLIFSSIWFALLFVPRRVRIARRQRRHRCEECGYDLAGMPSGSGIRCPECGAECTL
jgi:DNA-directed RNA polymerase subunit RPC12/RpoP